MGTFYRDQELLANQFCDSAEFKVWLYEKMRSYDNAGDWAQYLQDNLDIYTAEGSWLDLLGVIIGQGRTVPDAVPFEYFGFVDTPAGVGFSLARFWDGNEPIAGSSILADPEYRLVLLGRIAHNFASVTFTGMSESLSIIFETTDITITPVGTAHVDIFVNKTLTLTEIIIFDTLALLPIAAGVSYTLTSA